MRFALVLVVASVLGCTDTGEDSWRWYAKFRRGDIVIFRLDGYTGLVHGVKCKDGECTYVVEHPKSYGRLTVREFEIGKAPTVMCIDNERGDRLVFQAGDRAAEALCKR